MRIRTPGGPEAMVIVQIAGLLARRMVCDVPVDDKLTIGGTDGLIWFGSRLDNYHPRGSGPVGFASGNARLRVKRC
jgi:phosphatidylserine decarboxylase